MKYGRAVAAMLVILMGLTGCTKASPADRNDSSDVTMEENVITCDAVPQKYCEPAEHAGTLQRFYYRTRNYDKDESEMEKYAVVYLPYDYHPEQSYDIMYLMHGYTGAATTWLGDEDDENKVKHCIDHMIEDHLTEPMIIVSCTYYDNNTDEETGNYDIYLVNQFDRELQKDLMPAVESAFSTYADSVDSEGLYASRAHRIFGGFSMGSVTTWSAQFLEDAISAQGYTPEDFYIYMATGEEDYARSLFEAQIREMERKPEVFRFGNPYEPDTNCAYAIGPGEKHNAEGRLRYIYNILPAFSARINATMRMEL
ncbi:MAG: hypothetical protein II067_00645 [Agathobacter sp.]|uniref:alpha/beta hydrolase n=1 Tax=Agathobacter sp. TaxID=2021311 RepID=UPI002579DDAC|nr:alpha/beta hydrolase-fold protein [Agathobacter sp.]MBQ1680704.1 hypothetical protein [Agathobacter sp.]